MRYIAKITSHQAQTEVERVKNLLLQSNPVMEAFGNAKTNRNDNSSRFVSVFDSFECVCACVCVNIVLCFYHVCTLLGQVHGHQF